MNGFKQLLLVITTFSSIAYSQTDSLETTEIEVTPKPVTKNWYERINIRGYAQVRYNGLLQTNPDLECEQCDKSWGGDNSFFIRRIRVIFYGQIHPRVYFYIQPDFASAPSSTNLHFAQIRDAYFDVSADKKGEFRFRIGQSKVPFGFENMQSSQNRLTLDRNDPLNSAVSNERDLGVFFYWAPTAKRKLFSELVKSGLKGSGDYGVFAFGAYNGQTANKPELNSNKHLVTRFTYPFEFKNQIIEPGIQAYSGIYQMPKGNISNGVQTTEDLNYTDERMAGTLVVYPKPFGFQAEYNVGRGPVYKVERQAIEVDDLKGGYALVSYMGRYKDQLIIPFVKYQEYRGGKKHELDARSYKMKELELGIEWQPMKQFELVVMYTMSSRRFEDFVRSDNYQRGNLLRIQAQVNF